MSSATERPECLTCKRSCGWVEADPSEPGAILCRGKAGCVWRKPCPDCNPWGDRC